MNRRTFLKGLVGAAVIATALPVPDPIDYKALRQRAQSIGFAQAYGRAVRVKSGDSLGVERDGVAIKPGEYMLVTGQADPSKDGVWQVQSPSEGPVTIDVLPNDFPLPRPRRALSDKRQAHYTWP